jgi:tRNA nucleotidyltransferase/poly(A) polymerase
MGDLALLGGAIRDFAIGKVPRDIDLVTSIRDETLQRIVSRFPHERNRLGGYKIEGSLFSIDVWSIENHLPVRYGWVSLA